MSSTSPVQPRRRSPLFWILVGAGGLVAIVCVCFVGLAAVGNRVTTPTPTTGQVAVATGATSTPVVVAAAPTTSAAVTDTPAPEPTAVPPTEGSASYGVNQDAKVGDVRWKFLEVTNAGNVLPKGDISKGEIAQEATTSGTFIKVRFEIENQGADQLTFTSVDLKDSKGRNFKSSNDLKVVLHAPEPERCIFEQLNPNIVKTCTVYFEVPADATGLQAIIGDLAPFGAEDAAVDLGL